MAGERTPTSTGHGSSDDDISLREHMQRQLDVIRDGAQIRLNGLQQHTDDEVAHVKDYFERIIQDERSALQAALASQQAFNAEQDRRYEQRFTAQENAVGLALARVDKEFHEHLAQVRAETHAALEAADKAISKSETATEKRFECVAADTPILCADLVWRPAGGLLVGDELVAFDEESQTKRGRRYCRSTVTANSIERDELVRVNTSVGSVRCNQQHPWLVRRKPGFTWEWIRTADLQPGYAVMHALDTWEVERLLAKAEGAWERKPLGSWGRSVEIESIESAGSGQIACLSTSTHTYIADGYAMHNSVNEFRAQLNDQAASFMGRSESISRHDRTAEAIAEISNRQETESRLQRERFAADLTGLRDRFTSDISTINSRLDKEQGSHMGGREAISDKRMTATAVMGYVIAGVTIFLAVLTVIGFILARAAGG